MLTRLLELVKMGGTRRLADLAAALGTTPELTAAMLEDLARMGYLRSAAGECGTACGCCSLNGLCAAGGTERVWTLTEKTQTGGSR